MTNPQEKWIVIFESADTLKAHLVQNLLQKEDIPAVVLSQRDWAFGFGTVKVMVPACLAERAKTILEQNEGLPSPPAEE